MHPKATATTAASVISLQKLRSSDRSCLQPEASATIAAAVISLQKLRSSDTSCLQLVATAITAASVIHPQSFRSTDESWGHFETTVATAASSQNHSLRSASSRIARAAHAAAWKDLLKCALETRSTRGFPSVSARITRSSLGKSARINEPSTRASSPRPPTAVPGSCSSGLWAIKSSCLGRARCRVRGAMLFVCGSWRAPRAEK